MDCRHFLERFSDYYDRKASDAFLAAAGEHLEACEECRRYVEVVRRGSSLLQCVPPVEVSDDFEPRLRHRIYHIEDGLALTPGSAGSGTTAATALIMAVLVSAAAWSPTLRATPPEVELSPIVVSHPEPRPLGLSAARRDLLAPPGSVIPRYLWDGSHALLYRYSTLSGWRQPGEVVHHAGFD